MIKLREDVVFHDPESRIREYCEIEVYRGYDDQHSIDDVARARNQYHVLDRLNSYSSVSSLSN